ncbi:ATP-grasp domain-containing protein [Sphaerimonospora sp. CA-214678]|uniref:ATP-grasp domain-containing protein n=1 Tax=Sphaerimonospora sp. CA-214678 TaxID=3240029 RepID=UPI003D8CB516
MKVAYVTAGHPVAGHDDEREIVLAAWYGAGIEGSPVVWDDPRVDWSSFDAAVVRSAWDYVERRDEFVAWARLAGAATRLFNPAPVIEWNTDKTYLRDLGVPTVPTRWAAPGVGFSGEGPADGGFPVWDEYVVKPTISAGARGALRTADRAVAEKHAAGLLGEGRTVMVQPYLKSVEHEGELSLLYFAGQFSHAVRRHPMLSDSEITTANRATLRDPDDDQFALAERVLAEVSSDLLYARVDLARTPEGEPVLMELELTEPYLFLRYELAAPDLFARALADLL